MQSLNRFYGLLLHLFPRRYREEYGEELQSVFNLSLDDAIRIGRLEVAGVILRELIGLPEAVIHEHLRERRKTRMSKRFGSHFDFPPGSRSEPIAVFTPFIVIFVLFYSIDFLVQANIFTFQNMPFWVRGIIMLSLLASIFITFVVGLIKGLPRWFLPYLGFVLSIANIFITNGIIDPKWRGFSFPPFVSRFVRDFVQTGVFWVGISILVFLVVVLAALIPAYRPFYRRLRNDWTLLAFILYGIAPFAIWLTFDDYQNAGPYRLTSLLTLALGGWLYLRSNNSWKKFMFLFIGLTLAMAVATLGAAVLIESSIYVYSTWQNAMVDTIMTWMWLAIFMLLPFAIKLLPRPRNSLQTT